MSEEIVSPDYLLTLHNTFEIRTMVSRFTLDPLSVDKDTKIL